MTPQPRSAFPSAGENTMSKIECRDHWCVDQDYVLFANELHQHEALLKANCSRPKTSKVSGISYIMALDPVIDYDETQVQKSVIKSVMRKYGFKER